MNYGGGGGFMPGSQGNGSPGGKKQANHTYRPVTIKQLHDAYQPHPDAEFKIDDVDLDHVTFVGNITNIGTSSTNVSLTLEDGTGSIDARLWLETAEDDTGRMEGIEQGRYVRIIGSMKSFNNKRSVNATVMKKITDYNEITYHMLQVIYVHLYHTRGPPPNAANGGNAMQGIQRPQQHQQNQQKSAGMDAYAMNGNGNASGGNEYAELKPLGRSIMRYIDSVGVGNLPEEGLHLDRIFRAIPNTTLEKVINEVNDLMEEGLLYTTSDSDHVLPTSV